MKKAVKELPEKSAGIKKTGKKRHTRRVNKTKPKISGLRRFLSKYCSL